MVSLGLTWFFMGEVFRVWLEPALLTLHSSAQRDLQGPQMHRATGSSFAVVEPFSSLLTLMGSWEISHLSLFYSAFHSCIFFVMHHLSVRDNNERS